MQEAPERRGPGSPGQWGGRNRKCGESGTTPRCTGDGMTGGVARGLLGKPQSAQHRPRQPQYKKLKVFQSSSAFPALICENFDHCPDPLFQWDTLLIPAPRLTATAPACRIETSVLCGERFGGAEAALSRCWVTFSLLRLQIHTAQLSFGCAALGIHPARDEETPCCPNAAQALPSQRWQVSLQPSPRLRRTLQSHQLCP